MPDLEFDASDDRGDDGFPDAPDHLQGHESIWNMAVAAELGGASEADRDMLADAHYEGYVNPNISPDDRNEWREFADDMRDEFGVDMDWDAWRHEMGYN
jgi:hypothetical protein